MKRKRYCNIEATSLEEILAMCNRHIKNINMTQYDLIDNGDGTETDTFYINMFREAWADLRDDVEAIMEKEKRSNMKRSPSAIHFEFAPAEDAARRNDGWGVGMLAICGRPYWFAGSETEPKTFEWTWVDFLEHLADVWGALVSEESYPFAWLQEVRHPGEIWKAAERRWAGLGEVAAAEEEPRLLAFDRRHNLSAGWMGIGLPALTWLRTGETLWLCPEAGAPIRASYSACRDALLTMGDGLAAAYAASTNPRVASAVGAWRTRDERFRSQFLELATGLIAFPHILECYTSGQMSERQFEEHLKDPLFAKWYEKRLR